MTAPETDLMTDCPVDIEELAGFIDGRLTSERRARVVEHLDTCADCREIVMTADEMAIAEASVAPNVVRGKFWKRALPAAAAAAMMTWLFVGPLNKSGMEKLVAASENEPERASDARFSAAFPYRDYSPTRGGPEPRGEYAMEAAAADVADVSDGASTKKLHAAGVAWLHLDEIPGHKKVAIQKLEEAAAKRPRDVAILTDLSAAYIADGQAGRALDAANRALVIAKTPAALWNRAYALQTLRRVPEARAAWDAYLQVDPFSQWATEVREEHLKNLE
ncbi:MAG TPA: zf-HC2 domain-containing protein [Thermoanaerobaculia bacterium]|jgi:tetratricopeptide (TPR) repeat protein